MAEKVLALTRARYSGRAELHVHPQCFLTDGHFAGDDAVRTKAFLEAANDSAFDAVWVARGGYGSNRIAEAVVKGLRAQARKKLYLGYSDAGFLLGALYRAGCSVAHGPVAADIRREGGEAAVIRALDYMIGRDAGALEPSVKGGNLYAAFNLTVLSHMIGTPLMPDLSGHVLMVEDVSEHMYRVDRAFFHITSNPGIRKIAGLRLGRVSDVLPNEPEFGKSEEDIARHWCKLSGIAWLGRADIGHDAGNKIVPFGRLTPA